MSAQISDDDVEDWQSSIDIVLRFEANSPEFRGCSRRLREFASVAGRSRRSLVRTGASCSRLGGRADVAEYFLIPAVRAH